ncbi:MAG: EamA family transporter [Saprospiraceae bacterium]|jgi:drug/metabolite transporter (DMT)-like permease|nr:EamA family transporter [Saprospiraceae bacterium]
MNNTGRAYLALAALCVIWGTTYTAIKYAIRDFPPFLMVAIRQTSAGIILIAWAMLAGKWTWTGRKYALRQALTGLATITGGNGFICWGMQYVSSGLAAIIGALTPVVVVLINVFWQGSEKINGRVVSGVLLGFGGLGFIFSDGWADFARPEYQLGIAGCFASCVTWSLGTVMSKQWNSLEVSPLVNAGLQVLAGGIGGIVMSLIFDKSSHINHTTEGWMAIVYLACIGSALAFTLYMFILKHLSATVSSLYTYVNPIVAILLGWLFLGEKLTAMVSLGMVITIAGVWLVNSGHRQVSRPK